MSVLRTTVRWPAFSVAGVFLATPKPKSIGRRCARCSGKGSSPSSIGISASSKTLSRRTRERNIGHSMPQSLSRPRRNRSAFPSTRGCARVRARSRRTTHAPRTASVVRSRRAARKRRRPRRNPTSTRWQSCSTTSMTTPTVRWSSVRSWSPRCAFRFARSTRPRAVSGKPRSNARSRHVRPASRCGSQRCMRSRRAGVAPRQRCVRLLRAATPRRIRAANTSMVSSTGTRPTSRRIRAARSPRSTARSPTATTGFSSARTRRVRRRKRSDRPTRACSVPASALSGASNAGRTPGEIFWSPQLVFARSALKYGAAIDVPSLEANVAKNPDDLRAHRALDYTLAKRAHFERSGAYFHLQRWTECRADDDRACALGLTEAGTQAVRLPK
ncbi:hypothetical protein BH09MYX1_BH09MYX1_17960 [soil metagenome]